MLKLQGENIYLAALEREHCRTIYEQTEYDFENPTEPLHIGNSIESSDEWYADIQKCQNGENIRLGIFLNDGAVIGDIALQNIDWRNRCCNVGIGFSKLEYRGKGYGAEAMRLMFEHSFRNLGFERIEVSTLAPNVAMQTLAQKSGFSLEGRQRKAVWFGGAYVDRLLYAILREDYCEVFG